MRFVPLDGGQFVLAGYRKTARRGPNRDPDAEKIIALSPNLRPPAELLTADQDTVRTVLARYFSARRTRRFGAGISMPVGAPAQGEEFIEVNGLWLPGQVRPVSSSFLLGVSELDIDPVRRF